MLQLELGVQPRSDAVLHQVAVLLTLGQRALGNAQLGFNAHQLKVSARHAAGQQHAGSLCIGQNGLLLAQCGIQRRAVFAEEVQLPAPAELQRADIAYRATQRWRVNAGGAEQLACHVQAGIELRAFAAAQAVLGGLYALQPGLRHAQAGAISQRIGH